MKKIKFIFLLNCLVLNSLMLNSQVKFINELTHNPISNVTLFSNKGVILGVSDINGNIDISDISNEFKIADSDTVEIAHSDFIPKKIVWNNLKINPTNYLTPGKELDEVVVTGKKQEYLVLEGYFVSYQLIDNTPQAFTDGIIEYYISLSKNKVVKSNIKENRVFNKIDSLDNKKKIISFTVDFGDLYPYNLRGEWLLSNKKIDIESSSIKDYII
ncbi:MAG: hypothetical protein LBQ84_03025, partial [Flavobacteriaceae bacterium]|nr:hypothetical protein [Flavobacteriaceae bacterium]